MSPSYRQEHEDFISGHSGTTFAEIVFITGIPCTGCILRDMLRLAIFHWPKSRCWSFILDFILLVLPSILSVTILSDHIVWIFLGMIAITSLVFLYNVKWTFQWSSKESMENRNLSEKTMFVTYFKSIVLICSCIGILGVDFPVYPRRLAKAETYGFGGMDVGVGYYIVSNAIISHEARGKKTTLPLIASVKRSFTSTMPLLVLGFARLASVKGIEYQEHVSEYGVHWNFFFTVAAIKIMSSAVSFFIPATKSGPLGVVVLVAHQAVLSLCGGSQYILTGSDGQGGRGGGLVDANREGIISLTGSLAIYLFGVYLGQVIFTKRSKLKDWLKSAGKILMFVILCGLMIPICETWVQPVSRRFANATYVFWIMCTSSLMLFECLLCDIASMICIKDDIKDELHTHFETSDKHIQHTAEGQANKRITRSKSKEMQTLEQKAVKCEVDDNLKKPKCGSTSAPCLLEAVSFNSLFLFLLANLMTGLVNMTIHTLYTESVTAVTILVAYMFILCSISSILHAKKISTKFW